MDVPWIHGEILWDIFQNTWIHSGKSPTHLYHICGVLVSFVRGAPHFDAPFQEALPTVELIAVQMPLVPDNAKDVATNEDDGHRLQTVFKKGRLRTANATAIPMLKVCVTS